MTTINKKKPAFYRDNITAPRKSLGLYLHIPFCVQKCRYCDFLSFGEAEEEVQNAYFRMLTEEIRRSSEIYSNKYYVDSIFIGGGTPSLVSEQRIAGILDSIREGFSVDGSAEISMESNPKTLTGNKLRAYIDAGVNRLSIGAQSLDDELLAYLGRVHTKEDFLKNYELARECGFRNINIDLMFAIPGQTMEIWTETIEGTLALEPEHISFYSIQIEEGTPFYSMLREGSLKQVNDELDREMYHGSLKMMRDRGYHHYEISNAAREGYRCRHNLKYWTMEDYLGLGLGAHSFVNGIRYSNISDLKEYCSTKGSLIEWRHENTKEENISEYLFTGMRKLDGIELSDFKARFGVGLDSLYGDVLEKYRREGLVEIAEGWLRFTETGIDISNRVLAEFV